MSNFLYPVRDSQYRLGAVTANVAPVLSAIEGTALEYEESDAATVITASIVTADADSDPITSARIKVDTGYVLGEDVLSFATIGAISGAWDTVTGQIVLSGSATLANYQAALRTVKYQNLSDMPGASKVISFVINDDSNDSNIVNRTITITSTNNAPTLSEIEEVALSFSEGDSNLQITNTISVMDLDDVNLETATISISAGYQSGEDSIVYPDEVGAIGGVWSSGTMTLTGPDTLENWETALRSLKFSNDGSPIDTTQRTFTFTVNDGDDDSNQQSRSVNILSVDLTSETVDGTFSVEFNGTGVVQAIKESAVTLTKKVGSDGGFYLRDFVNFGTPANDFLNGDFETGDTTNWTKSGSGTATVLSDDTNYLRLDGTAGSVFLYQSVNVIAGHTYVFRGRHRSSGTGSGNNRALNLIPTGCSWYNAGFSIANPNRNEIAQNQFLSHNNPITAWTDFEISLLADKGCTSIRFELRIWTTDAITWDFDDLTLEDMDLVGTRMTHSVSSSGSDIDFTCSGQNTTLAATITEQADHLVVEGTLTGNNTSRTLGLDFCLPLDQTGWTWWDNLEDSDAYVAGTQDVYYEEFPPAIYYNRQLMTYPDACITDGTRGITLANSVEQPRHFKLFRDDNGLWIRHHAGLHSNRNTFSFKFILYKFGESGLEEEWGKRSSIKKYQAIYSTMFEDKIVAPNFRHGVSVFYINKILTDTYDFGINFDFRGWSQTGKVENYDDGVAFGYHVMGTEHSITGTPLLTASNGVALMAAELSGMDADPHFNWPPDYVQDRLGELNVFSVERTRHENTAVLYSNLIDYPGTTFGSDLTVLGVNSSPNCASPNQHEGELNVLTQNDIDAVEASSRDYRGASHDNVGIGTGRADYNFNTTQFSLMDTDLSWDLELKQVCMLNAYTYWESLKAYSDIMHSRTPEAITVGNMTNDPQSAVIFLNVMDQLGGETQSGDEVLEHAHHPSNFLKSLIRDRRALAGTRCINGILTKNPYTNSDDDLDRVWSLCYLYGWWPAMRGINYTRSGAEDDFAEEDRTTCDLYFPLLKLLDAAKHQLIPYATCDDSDITLERFGEYSTGNLYFTLYNDSDVTVSGATVTIDKTALGIAVNTDWTKQFGVESNKTNVNTTFNITVEARRSVVYSVMSTGGVTYLTKIDFDTIDAAPLTNPYSGSTGSITSVATETPPDGQLSASGGNLLSTTQDTPTWGELGYWDDTTVVRAAGKIARFDVHPTNTNFNAMFGWGVADSVLHTNHDAVGFFFGNPSGLAVRAAGSTVAYLPNFVAGEDYSLLDVTRATGNKLYYKTGSGSYKLAWTYSSGTTTPLRAWCALNNGTGVLTQSTLRVPDLTFIQDPEVADGFTGSNTTDINARNSDADSPAEETGGSGKAATLQLGSAEIDTNKCKFTHATEALITYPAGKADVHCLFNFDPVNSGAFPSGIIRWTSGNYWKFTWDHVLNELQIWRVAGGVASKVAYSSKTPASAGESFDMRVIADDKLYTMYVNNLSKLVYDSTGNELNTAITVHGARSEDSGDLMDYIEIWDLTPTVPAF